MIFRTILNISTHLKFIGNSTVFNSIVLSHFSLYAAIVIMVNYILMMTWLPAMVIIVERMNMKLCKCWQSYVNSINVLIDRIGMQNVTIHLAGKFKYMVFIVISRTLHRFKPKRTDS